MEDVKLSISFQNLPAAKELNISGTKDSFQNLSGPRELNLPGVRELNLSGSRELNLSSAQELNISGPGVNISGPPGDIALASPQQVRFSFKQT